MEKGRRFAVLQLHVGSDTKACQEAWNAVQAAHPGLPALFITVDEGVLCSAPQFPAVIG